MKALVTGGAGFIGTHLSGRLLDDGHQVLSVDDLSTGVPTNVAELADRPGYEFIKGSVVDAALIDSLVAKVDTVFHLAAAVGVQRTVLRPLAGGTRRRAEPAHDRARRAHHRAIPYVTISR